MVVMKRTSLIPVLALAASVVGVVAAGPLPSASAHTDTTSQSAGAYTYDGPLMSVTDKPGAGGGYVAKFTARGPSVTPTDVLETINVTYRLEVATPAQNGSMLSWSTPDWQVVESRSVSVDQADLRPVRAPDVVFYLNAQPPVGPSSVAYRIQTQVTWHSRLTDRDTGTVVSTSTSAADLGCATQHLRCAVLTTGAVVPSQ
jgi:hypothetical protein